MDNVFIRVGSRIMMDIELALDGVSHIITGISHPVTDGMAVTENVPAEAFRNWMKENAASPMVSGSQIFELPEDFDATPRAKIHGFQPALEAAMKDPEQQNLAAQGSPEEAVPPVPGSAGVAVPLPDEMPAPPDKAVIVKQVPNATTHEEKTEVPVSTSVAAAADGPAQDIDLSGDRSGDSSNQSATDQTVGPTETQTKEPANSTAS